MSEILVLNTTDTMDMAEKIAFALVEGRDAACVSIVSGIRSIYSWEGKVCDEGECLLLIKTAAEKFDSVRSRIRKLHSYDVPEIIAMPVAAGDPDYLSWMHNTVGSGQSAVGSGQ